MKNSVWIIHPYRVGKIWAFDDERFGLKTEPFVGETNLVIDNVLKAKSIKADKFTLIFSRFQIPRYDAKFSLVRTEGQTNKSSWYKCNDLGINFWLCPALNHYFDEPPENIFVEIIV